MFPWPSASWHSGCSIIDFTKNREYHIVSSRVTSHQKKKECADGRNRNAREPEKLARNRGDQERVPEALPHLHGRRENTRSPCAGFPRVFHHGPRKRTAEIPAFAPARSR